MGKSIDNQPTSVLIAYQQMIGLANQQMDQFQEDIKNIAKEGTISNSYVRETIGKIKTKMVKNNEHLAEIEDELFKRVKRDHKGATTPDYMTTLFKQFHEEKKAESDRKKSSPKKETKTINLDVDTEKK